MKPTHPTLRSLSSVLTLCTISGQLMAADTRIDTATQGMQRSDLKRKLQEPALEAVPSLYKEESSDVGPQYIVKEPKQRTQWLEAAADVQYGYTSNVYLSEKGTYDSSLTISTVQVAIAPAPFAFGNGTLALKTGYRHQKFNYGILTSAKKTLNDLDFDVSTFFTQGRYTINDDWAVNAGLDYNRLLTAAKDRYDEFYSEYVPNISLDRSIKVDDKSLINASLGTAYHLTSVDAPNTDHNNRFDGVLMLSYTRELGSDLTIQPFYRAQFSQYTRVNRQDFTQTAGVVLSYSLNPWASFRTYANFETRESTDGAITDYMKFDAGLGASLQIRF